MFVKKDLYNGFFINFSNEKHFFRENSLFNRILYHALFNYYVLLFCISVCGEGEKCCHITAGNSLGFSRQQMFRAVILLKCM